MTETILQGPDQTPSPNGEAMVEEQQFYYYRIRFRDKDQEHTAQSHIPDLPQGATVMATTDHGPEPARIVGRAPGATEPGMQRAAAYVATRRANREEEEKYERLPNLEQEAFAICLRQIKKLNLPMQLVRVERFFNGSKIIFFFTADNRVDFRELVKCLVQEFRTRVEMRQIGVRHETKMLGGIGACGRELCCCSFLKKFESISIKMAKTQDLPLNPAKISGLCNRLLCCLTYEYDSYRTMKKGMPRLGKCISHAGQVYRVVRLMPLQGSVLGVSRDGEELVLTEEQWRAAKPVPKPGLKGTRKGQTTKK